MRTRKPKKKLQRVHRQSKRSQGLRARLEQGPFREMKFVTHPSGVEKMSDVLSAFVEPFADQATDIDSYSRLLTLGILAWNASLHPEPRRTAMIEEVLEHGLPGTSEDLSDGLVRIVRHLIARKEIYFADSRRAILDFELRDLGDRWHLNVASVFADNPPIHAS